jgi:hypothetical protein
LEYAAATGAKIPSVSAVAPSGISLAVRLGKEGEATVRSIYEFGPKTMILVNGIRRVPDGLIPSESISEVKNVQHLRFTAQLRDYAVFAEQNGIAFDLYCRDGACLSRPLVEAIEQGRVRPIPSRSD